jgi:hypothetical protein
MIQRQRENLSKYLYDLSKILFATAVVGNLLASRSFNVLALLIGGGISYICFWWGHVLDGIKE